MSQRGSFLLVTRDDLLARSLTEAIQRYSVVRRASSFAEARTLLVPDTSWVGVIADVDGLEVNPLEAVRSLREVHPLLPVLTIASSVTPELLNGLHASRAELILKPFDDRNVVYFVQRALVSGWLPDERVAAWVEELGRRHMLTAREVQLVAYALGNESRQRVIQRLGISENTLKTQVRALLRKCGARSMDSLAKAVLRDALVFETEPRDFARDDDMVEVGRAPALASVAN